MALTTLTTDVSVISKLDNYPPDDSGMSSAILKAKFDEGSNAIKSFVNGTLIPEIGTQFATKDEVNGIMLGQVLDGSITTEKLSAAVNSEIDGKAEATQLIAHTGNGDIHVTAAQKTAWNSFSHKNLLHNWDFRNPVNQRAVSGTISSTGYFIDQWSLEQGSVALITNTGVKLIHGSTPVINQYLENVFDIATMYTISAKIDGVLYSVSFAPDATATWHTLTANVSCRMCNSGSIGLVSFANVDPANDYTISLVKVELGTVSTLANDPPADYGEQLALCQRYFLEINPTGAGYASAGSGYAENATTAYIDISTPVTMRCLPTITKINSWDLRRSSGTLCVVTGISAGYFSYNCIMCSVAVASGLTAGEYYKLLTSGDETARLQLSADL